jgi:hypothetical protein
MVSSVIARIRWAHLVREPVVELGTPVGVADEFDPEADFGNGRRADIEEIERLRGDEGEDFVFWDRPDTGKRYIALSDGLGLRFPVKRVIVGPGARQEERAERACSWGRGPSARGDPVERTVRWPPYTRPRAA